MAQPNTDASHLSRLRDHYAKHGVLPSYARMSEVLGFRAKNAAVKLAERLSLAGYLRSAPGGKLVPTARFFELPLIDTPVRAGLPEAIEGQAAAEFVTIESYLIESPSSTVLVPVRGDSMKDAGIFSGDIAIVDRALAPSSGAFVVALVDGEFTVKELRYQGAIPILAPHNAEYQPIRPSGELEVFGVVRGIVRKLKGGIAGGPEYTQLGGIQA
ncbi:LexA family protein [Rubrivivax gelatinosus]|uniref:LexA family protein n=1 Tax=Rubrivivax gelatinosus TaxID=28068 RepID=UPI0002E407AA|nr:S24 family peptidase [Rubrivivax gelatinosus]MBG6082438.1 repressor LexA [Rubrivivax gelatinosus]